jgi:hypothetical protein
LLRPIPAHFPCWSPEPGLGGAAASFTVPREAASVLLCDVLSDRLRRHLRLEKALSYSPAVAYEALTADRAHVVAWADSAPERRGQLADSFVELLEGLAEGLEADVEPARKRVLDAVDQAERDRPDLVALQMVQSAARDHLLGSKPLGAEEVRRDFAEASLATVATVAKGLRDEALVALPPLTRPRPWVGEHGRTVGTTPITGVAIARLDAPITKERLVSSPEGVTVQMPDGAHLTIRYGQLAAALRWSDGGIALISRDATELRVEPTLWRDGQRICDEIRARIPKGLLLERGERPLQDIPKPATTRAQRWLARLSHALPRAWLPLLLVAIAAVGLAEVLELPAALSRGAALFVVFLIIGRLSLRAD